MALCEDPSPLSPALSPLAGGEGVGQQQRLTRLLSP